MGNLISDKSQQRSRRGLSHRAQRLMDGGEWWVVHRRNQNIVKTKHRDIVRDPQARLAQRQNGSDRCYIVKCKDRCKWLPGLQ